MPALGCIHPHLAAGIASLYGLHGCPLQACIALHLISYLYHAAAFGLCIARFLRFRQQVHRRFGVAGHIGGLMRALILAGVSMGAHIFHIGIHTLFRKVQAVLNGVAGFCPARLRILQSLGAVEKIPAFLLAHIGQHFVQLVHFALLQAFAGAVLIQRRYSRNDHREIGVFFLAFPDRLAVVLHRRAQIPRQIVAAEAKDHTAGLNDANGLWHGDQLAVARKLHTGKAGDGAGGHARAANVAGQRHRTVQIIAHGVGVAHKQRFFYVILARIRGFFQHGARIGAHIQKACLRIGRDRRGSHFGGSTGRAGAFALLRRAKRGTARCTHGQCRCQRKGRDLLHDSHIENKSSHLLVYLCFC